ncbi:hypothetical protein EMPS_09519 [Entomortierella parvispora]|uniref:Uncharacterized protein n=1 Tax=Entomortierella parvispora TaxID=205924 RepID=A0A9P3HI75_9FUNG|nr:hypothetical protein EMPS_09519 [Entomortierella parvispora]
MSSSTQLPSRVHHHDHPLKHHHDLHCQTEPYFRASNAHMLHNSTTPVTVATVSATTEKQPTRASFQVTPELQKRGEDTIKEILGRLERQRHDSNGSIPVESPTNEADQHQQQAPSTHHSRRLTPDFLKEARSMNQHHGDANLRHG